MNTDDISGQIIELYKIGPTLNAVGKEFGLQLL
jgi:hypothetical protein